MNCFVIMPFAPDFDDVYAVIKTTVESAAADAKGRCFRLDESRQAGRITDRLLSELRAATICIADLTGNKPNVMWELGFAMALEKPTIVVTQSLAALPFDIKDMQSIEYSRNRLSATLGVQLRQCLLDTLGTMSTGTSVSDSADAATVGLLLNEVSQLKHMVAEAVNAWKPDGSRTLQPRFESLVGHWLNIETGSHVYPRIIRGELVAPYCHGDNTELTGVYFGWRRTGEYWFAHYQWLESDISGFLFLRMQSFERMSGAWWSSKQVVGDSDAAPRSTGVDANWVKQGETPIPSWAEEFLVEVEREGLAARLAKYRTSQTG